MTRQRFPLSFVKAIFLISFLVLTACQEPQLAPTTPPGDEEVVAPTEPAAASDDAPAPTSTPTLPPLPELSFAVETMTPISAGGEVVTTEAGVAVQLAADVLGDDVTAELSQWQIDPTWRQALERVYIIDAPFVSLTVSDVNDSRGRAVLRLPAAGPDSRLVVFLDNTYLAVLDVLPKDGFLETAVRLGPAGSDAMEQVGSLTPGGSVQYTVLTPRTTAAAKSRLGKPAGQNGRSCGLDELSPGDADHTYNLHSRCRKSSDGSVQVNFLVTDVGSNGAGGSQFSDAEGEQLADAVATAMNRYGNELGFTAAKLTPNSPMQVIVENRSGDPRYRSLNGVIYLPLDAARQMIGGPGHDTLHEIAHWIQDEAYNMAWAYWSGGKTWWLETAAENMVMLYDPAYIPQNLITYGAITTSDNRLALQQAPYQWSGDFYVHAQLVKLNMCDDTAVCPLSQESFVSAINDGAYPFAGDNARSKMSANLDAYAKYLLGVAPGGGNPTMPVGEPVTSGDRYGEYIQIAQTNKSDFDISFNGVAPQMEKGTDELGDTVQIAAALQKDGVYPLTVSSSFNGRYPGLPVKLTIQPGAPFWYRVGNDAPQYHDGGEELVLQPIHLTMGLPGVRLVALGKAGGEVFRATVSQIDLQGAWLVTPGEPVVDNITCVDSVEGEGLSTSLDANTLLLLPTLVGALGDYRPDPAGNGLTWEVDGGRLPSDIDASVVDTLQFEGAVLPGADKVQMQSAFEWPRTTGRAPSQPGWSLPLLGLAIVVPGVWGWRRGRKRPYGGLISLALALFLLTGCFGLGLDIWGTVSSEATFTEIEYVGGEAIPVVGISNTTPEAAPLWRLRGTADYTVDFQIAASAAAGEGDAAASTTHCTGMATYNVEALIYKDMIVEIE